MGVGGSQVAEVVMAGRRGTACRGRRRLEECGIRLRAVGVGATPPAELREIASRPAGRLSPVFPTAQACAGLPPKLRQDICDTLASAAAPVSHISPGAQASPLYF